MYTNLKLRAKIEYFSMCVLVSSVVSMDVTCPAVPWELILRFISHPLLDFGEGGLVSLVRSPACQVEDGSWKSCALGSQIMGLESSSGSCRFCIYCGRLGRMSVSLHQARIGVCGKWPLQEHLWVPSLWPAVS